MTILLDLPRKTSPPPLPGSIQHKLNLARQYYLPRQSQAGFAKLLKTSRSTVAVYESQADREPPIEYVEKVAGLVRWPIAWFWDGKKGLPELGHSGMGGIPPGSSPPAPSDRAHKDAEPGVGRRLFPLLGSIGAASFPIESADPWPGDFVEFAESLYRRDRFVLQIDGISMFKEHDPASLEPKDYVLIQPDQNPPFNLLVALVSEEHQYTVKVKRETPTGTEYHPLNDAFPILRPTQGLTEVGYVVGIKREKRPDDYLERGTNAGIRA